MFMPLKANPAENRDAVLRKSRLEAIIVIDYKG
jgi:hypothetical protein